MATVRIPPVLRPAVAGERQVVAEGATIQAVLTALATTYPELQKQLFSESGELNRFVNVYLNDEDVRVLGGVDTAVGEADEVVILPAMAGGV